MVRGLCECWLVSGGPGGARRLPANCHKRSNVETTFSTIKAKFGDSLLARSDVGKVNEVLCKVLAHDLVCAIHAMHELGIEPQFRQEHAA